MAQDSYTIIHQSEIDQEFAYCQNIYDSPLKNSSHTQFEIDSALEFDHSFENSKIDLFEDPSYYKQNKVVEETNIRNMAKKIASSLDSDYSIERGKEPLKQKLLQPGPQPIQIIAKKDNSKRSIQKKERDQRHHDSKTKTIKKQKKGKRQQYPTKNFLPSFRSSFINYLSPHFDSYVFNEMQIIKRIRGKPCINLADYTDLFNVEEFKPILRKYFKEKVIYRDLMQSRIDFKTKCVYFTRIHVFQEAFIKGVFTSIN